MAINAFYGLTNYFPIVCFLVLFACMVSIFVYKCSLDLNYAHEAWLRGRGSRRR